MTQAYYNSFKKTKNKRYMQAAIKTIVKVIYIDLIFRILKQNRSIHSYKKLT